MVVRVTAEVGERKVEIFHKIKNRKKGEVTGGLVHK